MNAELTCIRGGMLLRSTHRSSQAIARSKYDWYRRHPGLKYQKFEKAKASWSLSSEGRDQSVLLFQTGCDAEQVHLSIRKPTSFDDILASRIFVFHAEPSGDYSFSLLRKGRDGVLRPLKEDPAETPPKYTGGNEAMFRQLAKNTTYPQKAAQEGIEGTVLVSAHIDRRSLQKRTSATRRRGPTGRATAQKVGTGLCFRGSYQDEPPHSHCLQIAIIPFKISIRTGGRKIPPAGSYFYEKCFLNLSQPVFLRVSTALLARNLSNVENKS